MLNKEWDAGMAGVAMECVASHVPDSNAHDSWVTQQRLIRHTARCWSFVALGIVDEDGRQRVLHSLGYLYSEVEKLDEAEKMYQRALRGREKTLGLDHTLTLDTVHNLGVLYGELGKLDEAKEMC